MATTFKVPKSPSRSIFEINDFLGVDLTNSGTNIDERRSPNAPNMVRSVPTKVRKRMGYYVYHQFDSHNPIYGAHILRLNEEDSDSVTNQNRALNTSSSYRTFLLTVDETELYHYGTPFFPRQSFHYEFDYTLNSGVVSFRLGNVWQDLEPATNGHVSGVLTYEPLSNTSMATGFYAKISDSDPSSLALNFQIKNLSIMYDEDSEYRYTVAPEDEGKSFPLSNVVSINEKDYAQISGDTSQVTSSGTEDWTDITFDVNQDVIPYDFLILKFKATTSTTDVNNTIINAVYSDGSTYKIYEGGYITNKSFDVVIPENQLGFKFESIQFLFEHTAGVSNTYNATFTNLIVNSLIQKTVFKMFSTVRLYHIGTELYSEYKGEYKLLYSNMNEKRSSSWQFDSYIYITDGKNFLRYKSGDLEVTDVVASGIGTIPVVTIARSPSGGGISYNDRNLLQAGYEERFLGDGTSKQYQLSYYPLDSTAVTVKIMQSDGSFSDMNENSGFTVDRTKGIVTFTTAPSSSPLDGEDNVYITAYKTTEGYADKIKKCTIGTMYGVNGDTDRLFLSGNSNNPNYDWHSEIGDPTYFADTSYSALGLETSAIVGYTRVGNYLATHKDEKELSQSVFIRNGEFVEETDESGNSTTTTLFKIVNTLQGAGAIAKKGFGYLGNEPLCLTREGVFAITSQDVTGEKYSQNRSFFLDGQLCKEVDLDSAYAVNFKNYYILAINDKLYMLDGLQPVATDKSLPYATRQYVGFYCTNVPAYVMWVEDDTLWFGTRNGIICCFYTDENALESYNDAGSPIEAWWETPELDGKLFYKNKTFRYLAVRLMSSLATSVTLYGKKHGIWTFIKTDSSSARYFAFSKIVFSKFSFSVDTSEKLAHTKVRIKKVDKARFKLENKELNEPFGIYDFALEYIESGNYKG